MNKSRSNYFEGAPLPSTIRSFILARPSTLETLRADPESPVHDFVELRDCEDDEAVSSDVIQEAQCLFLEVNPDQPSTVRRIESIRRIRPDLPVIAMVTNAEFQLARTFIRQGVRDILSLPLRGDDVVSIIMDVAEKFTDVGLELAPVITVASPTGGNGATTIVTHLGAALARAAPDKSVCIIDLDVQFGDIANYLGLEPKTSVMDLLEAGDRLDNVMVREAAVQARSGPFVIAAPKEINPLEEINPDRLQQFLHICRSEFDFVLLDLPSNWTNWVLSVALSSEQILLVTAPSLHSIRRARRCLDIFEAVNMTRSKTKLVVNRAERRLFKKIDVDDVADTLHRDLIGKLPLATDVIAAAQDQGLLVTETSGKSAFPSAVDELAHELLGTFRGDRS